MKTMIIYYLSILVTMLSLSLYSQGNINMTGNLEQRERVAKEFIIKKLAEGTSAEDIQDAIHDQLIKQIPEYATQQQAYQQLQKVESQLTECKRQHCQSLHKEYDLVSKSNTRSAKELRNEIWGKLRECEEECSTAECQSLCQQVDQLRQEYVKANETMWSTPEGKLHKKLSPLRCNQSDINIVNNRIREERVAMRPLKNTREELKKEQEKLSAELKAQLAQ